jgi:hypothetical protein
VELELLELELDLELLSVPVPLEFISLLNVFLLIMMDPS